MKPVQLTFLLTLIIASFLYLPLSAQVEKAPDRQRGEGHFTRVIIKGVTLINGNLAPPRGPVDIVVEGNKIVSIRNAGYPNLPLDPTRGPEPQPGDHVIEAEGMFIMSGSIKLNENNEVVCVGGVKYTIKDGIIYDAKQLLEDVK